MMVIGYEYIYNEWRSGSFAGKFGDNGVELIEGEAFVGGGLVVDAGAVHHLEDVVVVDAFLEIFAHGLELLEVDHSVLILVVVLEDPSKSVLGLALSHSVANNVNELFEVDGASLISKRHNQREHVGASSVET